MIEPNQMPEAEPVSEEGDTTRASQSLDDLALYKRLQSWFLMDYDHSRDWRAEAKRDYEFFAGEQWSKEDRDYLESQGRPVIVFNRVMAIIKSVAGIEINGRHETTYLPRSATSPGQVKANEILTAASQWMADGCDAEDEQSIAFQDAAICGMGWTEAVISWDDDPEGEYDETRIDPREMYWDRAARAKNLVDARRMWRVKKYSLAEARELAEQMGAGDLSDADLDAPWAMGGAADDMPKPIEQRRLKLDGDFEGRDPQDEVHLVHAQWIERKSYWRVADPQTGQVVSMDDQQYRALAGQAKAMGLPLQAARATKKVYKTAILGGTIIGGVRDSLCQNGYTWSCITGEQDYVKGVWFGLMRVMRDPQMWANKWASQTLHILNTTAKGGVIAESDAFKDIRAAQETWAQPDAITEVMPGAISKGKIMAKPGQGIPAPYVSMMEFAISSIRDTSGINMELMGLRDANQPGILEAQRKQAAMTILATFFDSLRRFRKNVGRVRLYYIQTWLSDGRMIRVLGDDGAQLMPLLKEQTAGDYEVIVDDAPTSPNQKEQTWQIIQQVIPAFREMLTPEALLTILEFSPLPSKLVDAFKEMAKRASQPDPEQEQQKQMMIAGAVAKIKQDEAGARLKDAQAEAARVKGIADLMKAGSAMASAYAGPAAQEVMTPEPWQAFDDDLPQMPAGVPVRNQMPQMPQTPMVPDVPPQQPTMAAEPGSPEDLANLRMMLRSRLN